MSNDCALRTGSRGADEVAAQVPAYQDRHMLRSMTATRRRTYEILVAALEHDETEREAFLSRECRADRNLRREVGSLPSG
jgi:hypothetical protein